jgi:hypothetical protein
LAPFLSVSDVRLDLLDCLHVDQRANNRTRLEPVGDFHRPGGLGETLGNGVMDGRCHREPHGTPETRDDLFLRHLGFAQAGEIGVFI